MVRAIVLVISILSGGFVWAQGFDDVLLTPHNLFPGGADSLVRDVCIVCHVEPIAGVSPRIAEALPMGIPIEGYVQPEASPMSGSVPLAQYEPVAIPLWNTQSTAMTFLPLPELPSAISKHDPAHRPYGPSFDCLACHDGVLGSDIHLPPFLVGNDEEELIEETAELNGAGNHPFSIRYPRAPSGEYISRETTVNLKRYWSIPNRDDDGVEIPEGPRSDYLGLSAIDVADPLQAAGLVRTFRGIMHCGSCHDPHIDLNQPFLRVSSKDLCFVCHQR